MTPFVVDANAIHCFQTERITAQPGVGHLAIDAITASNCIALDNQKLCLQEWLDCAGGQFPFALADWVGDQVVAGKIRFYGLSSNKCRKDLLSVGLPPADHKWVRLAVGCGGRKLVSEDIDFFDPSKKKATAEVKKKLKERRKGPCVKHLKNSYGIQIMCLAHVVAETAALND
jgi:hypothetical protein